MDGPFYYIFCKFYLHRLDINVTRKATILVLSLGILSTLLMGFGMSLVLSDLGAKLGIKIPMIPGILFGIIGMVGVLLAYPLYQRIFKRERQRIGPQILKLVEELSEE